MSHDCSWTLYISVGKDIGSLICNVGTAAAAAAPAAATAPAGDEAKAEEKVEAKKEESEESSDEDMGFGMFTLLFRLHVNDKSLSVSADLFG